MQKINIFVHKSKKSELVDMLQNDGVMEIVDISQEADEQTKDFFSKEQHDIDFNIAEVDFSIKFLNNFVSKKQGIKTMFENNKICSSLAEIKKTIKTFYFKDIVEKCRNLEDQIIKNKNCLKELDIEERMLIHWKNLSFSLKGKQETSTCKLVTTEISIKDYEFFKEETSSTSPLIHIETINETNIKKYILIVFHKDIEETANLLIQKYKLNNIEILKKYKTPKKELKKIKEKKANANKLISKSEAEAYKYTSEIPKLKIVYDYLNWSKNRQFARRKFLLTSASAVISGWIPNESFDSLKKKLYDKIKIVDIIKVKKEKNENPPVAIKNKQLIEPFESVTNIYGLPRADELDPTSYLSIFFIIFFALCLTDAGYGLTLSVLTGLALTFLPLGVGAKKLVRLLFYGGIITFIAGILFGGWFGMTLNQAPFFLHAENGKTFIGQIINATEGNGPLIFLVFCFIIGLVHIMFGVFVDGLHKLKTKKYYSAFKDSFLWLIMTSTIIFYVLSNLNILFEEHSSASKSLVLLAALLIIIFQGGAADALAKSLKKIFKGDFLAFLKEILSVIVCLFKGILSLYGLVGYLSDILSYSRIMALGLTTGIIALAMNTVAGIVRDLIPVVGIFFAIIVLLLGHAMNLGLSVLGSFIHSGRLQFVEFFGKFLEGGGMMFNPLRKESKYVEITNGKQ